MVESKPSLLQLGYKRTGPWQFTTGLFHILQLGKRTLKTLSHIPLLSGLFRLLLGLHPAIKDILDTLRLLLNQRP